MQAMVVIFDFLLGCHHGHLSRVFTIDGQTYKVCCDCGAKFNYSLENMCIERPTRALGAARNVVLMEDRRSREKKSLPSADLTHYLACKRRFSADRRPLFADSVMSNRP